MAVDCITCPGTARAPLVCNVCFNLKWSIFGFYPTSHIENKNDTPFRDRLVHVLKENRDEGPTDQYEERWSKSLCYPRHSNFRGSDMSCLKVREWMVPNVLHYYLNSTELRYTTQYSVVWQIGAKLIYKAQNRERCLDIVSGNVFYFVHEMQADKTRSCCAVMLPFDTLCHDIMYCMLNSFDR